MTRGTAVLAAVLALVLGRSVSRACPPAETVVVVDLRESRLHLCAGGGEEASFPVSLGRGGLGKRTKGDHRTPVGAYALGAPRSSKRFHVFIPVGYPTAAQAAAGFSGGDVGVHGPMLFFAWAGRLNTLFAWTDGCVAVGTDEEIERIARWVDANHPREIRLE
jgi:murein L,D-transpeptidase YafK